MATDDLDELHHRMIKGSAEEGVLVEAGWRSLKIMAVPTDAPPNQVEAMRDAFFCGAQHMFAAIMTLSDDGADGDNEAAYIKRMEMIDAELRAYAEDLMHRSAAEAGGT